MSELELFKLFRQENIKTTNKSTRKLGKINKSRDIETDDCEHASIITEKGSTICTDCGREIQQLVDQDKECAYYGSYTAKKAVDPNRVQARRVDDKSIYKDVENLGFNDEIVTLANKIYEQVSRGKIHRGKSRKGIIFGSFFHATKQLGHVYSHDKLLTIFGLDSKTGLEGLKTINLNIPKGSEILTTYITPLDLVREIMDDFSATEEQKKEVKNLYYQIENRSSKLNRSRPKSIASGLVYYWIKKSDKKISIKSFAEKVSLSELTINKIATEIRAILEKDKTNIKESTSKKNE